LENFNFLPLLLFQTMIPRRVADPNKLLNYFPSPFPVFPYPLYLFPFSPFLPPLPAFKTGSGVRVTSGKFFEIHITAGEFIGYRINLPTRL